MLDIFKYFDDRGVLLYDHDLLDNEFQESLVDEIIEVYSPMLCQTIRTPVIDCLIWSQDPADYQRERNVWYAQNMSLFCHYEGEPVFVYNNDLEKAFKIVLESPYLGCIDLNTQGLRGKVALSKIMA